MEKQLIKSGVKNTIFVVFAQSIKLLIGIVKVLLLPILLGITNFGYWQVYLLYVSYLGFFAFGFNDGIYLKYGKYDYDDLPRPVFRSSIRLFVFIQIIITLLVSLIILFEPDSNKQLAMLIASINIPLIGLSGVLIYVLQVTNQLKKYSLFIVLENAIALALILLALYFNTNQFLLIIFADVFARVVVLIFMIYSCKELIFGKGAGIKIAAKEIIENVNIGIKLMLAAFAGMMILGYGRFIVERFESVEIYGSYAFAISTTNIFLIFIGAVGLVIYPTLNRLKDFRYPTYFNDLNTLINIFTFILLIFYFPLKVFIGEYMEKYIIVIEYLPLIFLIIFIQTKMQILINPFYKLLREEKIMLIANIIGFLIALILVTILYFTTGSIIMVVFSTFAAMAIRLYLSEIYLKKYLAINSNKSMFLEILFLTIFLVFAFQSNIIIGFLGYFIILLVYLFIQKKNIFKFINYFFRG